MEHPEDYKLRKRYEADRASGIAPGSMAQWMNDTAFKGESFYVCGMKN